MTERQELLREAYDALGRGELAPWMRLLDPGVVWRGLVEGGDAGAAPT